MNIPWHPAVVHLPIGLGVAIPLVLLFLIWGEKKGFLTASSWLVGIFLQLMTAVSGLVAMKLGERDEELIEHLVPESVIEHHEEWGEFFVWGAFGLLVLFILSYLLKRFPVMKLVSLVAAIFFLAVIYVTGHSGGELVYSHGAVQALGSM